MPSRSCRLKSFIAKIETQVLSWYADKRTALTDNDKLIIDYAVPNLRVELSKLSKSIVILGQSERDAAFESVFRIALFSYHVGHQSPVSDSLALRFNLKRGATARAGKTNPGREAKIAEVIKRHTTDWKGKTPTKITKISEAISNDLTKEGVVLGARAVRNRLIELRLSKPRKSNRRTRKTDGKRE